MSLVCAECSDDLERGETLPGKEGGFIYTNLVSRVYVPPKVGEKTIKYELVHLQAPIGVSVHFACIEKSLDEDGRHAMKKIYRTVENEMCYIDSEAYEGGHMYYVNPSLLEKYEKSQQEIGEDCIACNKNLPAHPRDDLPFFTVRAIDRVKSPLGITNSYQFLDNRTGRTHFHICFEDVRNHLPEAFDKLSYLHRSKRK